MQVMPHQAMGYDRAITVFSPDGRLLQVEYAKKAVSLGAIALGIATKNSIVLVADRHRQDGLLIAEAVRKIFQMDEHVTAAAAGIMSDARVLVKQGRSYAQQHKMTYGEKIDIESLVRFISDIKQNYTQYGGIRPFGISILIGGIDKKGAHLYVTDPTGIYFKYKAKAIGNGSNEANAMLEKKYKDNMTTEDAIKLAKEVLKKVLDKEYSHDRLECAVVTKDGVETIDGDSLK